MGADRVKKVCISSHVGTDGRTQWKQELHSVFTRALTNQNAVLS